MTEEISVEEAENLITQLRKLQRNQFKRLVVSQLELWHSMDLTTYKIKFYRTNNGSINMTCPDPSRQYWGHDDRLQELNRRRWKERDGHGGFQRRGSEGVWQSIRDIVHYGRVEWSTVVAWVKSLRTSGHADLVKGKITLRDNLA